MTLKVKRIVENKYFIFTVCFWAFAIYFVYHISSRGLCMVGGGDAVSQHYPIMVYVRSLWVAMGEKLLQGKRFTIPMVNFAIGMGDDTITALSYYGLGDPFYLLTVLFSEENLPYFYSVLFYLRVYLGGTAFIALASELDGKKSSLAYVMGAFVYCFTGFTSQGNVHVIFIHAILYTPLMLLGAERLMNNKKKGLLCITTCCFALSGFYFLYIASISLAVYVLYRMIRRRMNLSEAVAKLGAMLFEYLLGIGLSAVIFVPSVVGFLKSNRVDADIEYPLMMSWTDIKCLIKHMFFPSEQELAVCTIGMLALICIVLAKKRWQEKINLTALFLTAVIPFFTFVMSGFNAYYTRWELVIDLYIAFLTFSIWDELEELTFFQKAGLLLVYLVLWRSGQKEDILAEERFEKIFLSYALILFVMVVLMPLLKRLKRQQAGMYILFFVSYFTVCITWKAIVSDRSIEMIQGRQAVKELAAAEGQQECFYRIDNERGFAEPRYGMNISLQQGYYGTMSYVSITNDYYVRAFEEWNISDADFNVWGLDQRAILETMCAVKYFVARTDSVGIVPYGFEYVRSTEDGEWSLYENAYALPLVYAYENIYDIEDYQAMSGLEKQQVMMQAAAVEGDTREAYRELEELPESLNIGDYTITDLTDAVWAEDVIKAEAGGSMTLTADIRSGCENYLFFTGDTNWVGVIDIKNRYVKYGHSVSPLIINLGTAGSDRKMELTITFKYATTFDPHTLQVMSYDFKDYAGQIAALKKDTDGKFSVEPNNISGTFDLKQDKILCFAVPYSDGWNARIDGKETVIHLVNDMFMGIEVPEGVHEIEMYYITPGMRAGAGISAGSLLFVIGYLVSRLAAKRSKS